MTFPRCLCLTAALLLSLSGALAAQKSKAKAKSDALTYPPKLPGGKAVVTDTAPAFLEAPAGLAKGVVVAKATPTIDFLYFPGQDYPGRPWSVWGEGLFANGKYYTSIGDHLAPAGNAFVYEYDPAKKELRRIVDVRKTLGMPAGHYTPGKIHTRLDLGSDGWLYFGTHRGSTRATTDANHYKGDWILRHHPESGKTEIVAHGPIPKHCIPVSVTDPKRLIFYGSTAPGDREAAGKFFAYDLRKRKLLAEVDDGPARAIALSSSTGRVYYTRRSDNRLMRYDAAKGGAPVGIDGKIGIRAASAETPDGIIYTLSHGNREADTTLYAFDVKSEKVTPLGPAAVGSQQYITALAMDAKGRYLYYCPGAHGGADRDGTPVVQFDTKTRTRKVIAFLAKHFGTKYGCTPKGTYGLALDDRGERLFITWNASRGGRNWECCALTVVHIPESERA
jgi:hypothetical protein